jgi:hypothetical protein
MNWYPKWTWPDDIDPPDEPEWRRPKTWGGKFKYRREYGSLLWVKEDQNLLLNAISVSAKAAQDSMEQALRAVRLGEAWDDALVVRTLHNTRAAMLAAGYDGESTAFVSADRIAVRTAQRIRERHKRIMPHKKYEANPTFRICAGQTHDAPVVVRRVENERPSLVLGDIGTVYCDGRADDAWSDCAYAEMTRMAGSWHVRFVWVKTVEKEKNYEQGDIRERA